MDVAARAANGYQVIQRQSHSGRDIEVKLFAEITAELVRAARVGQQGFHALVAALHRNRTLWDALLADLAHEGNELPAPLKAELIRLGHFVRQCTARVLRREDDVQILIDVNNAILDGLRTVNRSGDPDDARP